MTEEEISSSAEIECDWMDWPSSVECERCREWDIVTGCLLEAAVDGLRSWRGEGARLIEAVWMVSATWINASSISGRCSISRC